MADSKFEQLIIGIALTIYFDVNKLFIMYAAETRDVEQLSAKDKHTADKWNLINLIYNMSKSGIAKIAILLALFK